jgi:hypothetical protein
MLPTEAKIEVFAPAKLNLFLAITGRRADGFHDLVSVAAKVEFGDTLEIERQPGGFALACDDPAVPVDEPLGPMPPRPAGPVERAFSSVNACPWAPGSAAAAATQWRRCWV